MLMVLIFKSISLNINGIRSVVTQSLFKNFLFDQDIDVALLQEINDDNLDFLLPQYKYVSNPGEHNRGTAIVYRAHLIASNIEQSPCGRIIGLKVNEIQFVNIYAPSGSNQRQERLNFFSNDIVYYLRNTRLHTALGGDFNCVVDSQDQSSSPTNYCNSLSALSKELKLIDVWRLLNPQKKEFTFFRNTSAARLDRFYVSEELAPKISNCQIIPVSFSDHSCVQLDIRSDCSLRPPPYGRNTWKLNTTLLNDINVC